MSELPRVSAVLSLLYPHSLDFVRQEDLERGTRLHAMMECYVNNQIVGFAGSIDPEIRPMVDWLVGHEVEFESAEEKISHAYGCVGHPDCIAHWGQRVWFDWKFSESITEQNHMQGNAYTLMLGCPGYFLQCPKDGKVKARKCKKDPVLLAGFLNGLGVLKFRASRKPAMAPQESVQSLVNILQEG